MVSRTCCFIFSDWHLLLFIFEHHFVINQSGYVVSVVTAGIGLIWTTPLGQTWSLTLMPFSATETRLPPSSLFTPLHWLPNQDAKDSHGIYSNPLHPLPLKLMGYIKSFVWTLTLNCFTFDLGQPVTMGFTSTGLSVQDNLCLVKERTDTSRIRGWWAFDEKAKSPVMKTRGGQVRWPGASLTQLLLILKSPQGSGKTVDA